MNNRTRRGKHIKSVDGARIHYEVEYSGSGEFCLVFLHGLTGNLTAWDGERKYFKQRRISTIALDLRGHGYSDRSNDKNFYSLDRFVQDVLVILAVEKFREFVLVGHCFGGMISIILEATYPKTSKSLVLVDTSFKPPLLVEPIKKHEFLRWILDLMAKHIPDLKLKGYVDYNKYLGTSDLDANRVLHDILHTSLRTFFLICEKLVEYNAVQLLKKILVPTLIIDGVEDSIFPPKVALSLKRRIRRSLIDLIPNANHVLVINNPQDLSEEIEKFLQKQNWLRPV